MTLKRYIFIFVLLSIIVKTLYLFISGVYLKPQTFEYEEIATHLLNGEGFYYTKFETKYFAGLAPGFPVFCYIVYKFFGHHHLLIIFIQILTTSLLVIPVSLIAKRIFDEKTAVLTGFLTALYPTLIVYSTSKLHSINIYCLIFALFVGSFLLLKESITGRRVVLSGFVAGLAVLFRATSLIFVVFALIWFYYVSRENMKAKLYVAIALASIIIVMSMPNIIRTYIALGEPVFLQTNKGESFWMGNMPGSSGSLYAEGGVALEDIGSRKLPPEFFADMNEIEKGNYLKKLTMTYFEDDPLAFIGRIFKKMYYFWYFSPNQGNWYPTLWMKLYKTYYLSIVFLGFFSVLYNFYVLRKRNWEDPILIALFFLALMCVHSLYYVEARHRWSIEPLLLIFAGNGLSLLYIIICSNRQFLFGSKKTDRNQIG